MHEGASPVHAVPPWTPQGAGLPEIIVAGVPSALGPPVAGMPIARPSVSVPNAVPARTLIACSVWMWNCVQSTALVFALPMPDIPWRLPIAAYCPALGFLSVVHPPLPPLGIGCMVAARMLAWPLFIG